MRQEVNQAPHDLRLLLNNTSLVDVVERYFDLPDEQDPPPFQDAPPPDPGATPDYSTATASSSSGTGVFRSVGERESGIS